MVTEEVNKFCYEKIGLKEQINLIKDKMGLKKTKMKHEYGCVMLFFDFPQMKELHNLISSDDIYIDPDDDSFGLETEPHITLLFGLHNGISTKDVDSVLGEFTFESCTMSNASLFENGQYDVLKFDVRGEGLHDVNDKLSEFPHTTDFPDYHPHMTIGYLKLGTGKKYVEKFKTLKYTLLPQYAVYSKAGGSKDKINIRID
jgi:2'-5' RNA ligase